MHITVGECEGVAVGGCNVKCPECGSDQCDVGYAAGAGWRLACHGCQLLTPLELRARVRRGGVLVRVTVVHLPNRRKPRALKESEKLGTRLGVV